MTAEERAAKLIAELDDVDALSTEELRAELEGMAKEETFLGVIASLALTADQFKRDPP